MSQMGCLWTDTHLQICDLPAQAIDIEFLARLLLGRTAALLLQGCLERLCLRCGTRHMEGDGGSAV